ncbi:hypothetical protein K8I61_02650 [bacterium]|nr:hypothetical protein [bacterium]
MNRTARHHRIALVALTAALVVATSAFGRVMFLCTMGGGVHANGCCCASDEATESTGTNLVEKACCDPFTISAESPRAALAPGADGADSEIVRLPAVDGSATIARAAGAGEADRAPPGADVPIYILVSSYLI